MRISYRRKRDGFYLFQNTKTGKLEWCKEKLPDHVLLSLDEREYRPEKLALGKQLILEMLEHAKLSESVREIEIVETELIASHNRDPKQPGTRGP